MGGQEKDLPMGMRIACLWLLCAGLAPAQDSKADPPGEAAQAQAEKAIRDIFKDEYSLKTVPAQRKLAATLLQQGRESKDDPKIQYVLFREAADLAARTGDLETLLGAVEAMSAGFKVEPVTLKSSFLLKVEAAVAAPDDQKKLVDALIQVTREALATDQFEPASKTALSSLAVAKKLKDLALTTRADGLSKSVQEAKAAFEKERAAEAVLKTSPDDAAANQARGEYLALVKGLWEDGLAPLSKGADGAMKSLASKELAQRAAGPVSLEIPDGWWDLAESEKSPLRKSRIRGHARKLYEVALPGASGLTRLRIESRLAEEPNAAESAGSAPREGLVGWWTCDEGKGATLGDSSGSGNDGFLEGVTWVKGRKGMALKFSGSKSHVTCKAAKLPGPQSAMTISWWHFRLSAATAGNLIIVGNESPPWAAVEIAMGKEKIGIWKLGGEPVMNAPDLRISTWTHGAYSFDGKVHTLYINGRLEARSEVAPQTGTPTRCELGRWWGEVGSGYYDGILDEIRIYNRTLLPAEIAALAAGKD
jgi:hypothetical protein